MKELLASILGGISAMFFFYFKGKSQAKKEVKIEKLQQEIDNQNEIKKIQKRVNNSKSDTRKSKLKRLRKRVKANNN
jgi:hypothetical protein